MSRLTDQGRKDRGYSLVEMLVTIVMLGLIMGSITAVIIASLKHQTALQDRNDALAKARNAIEIVDRDLRSANPICYGTGTEVTMLETDPASGAANKYVIVDYQVVGGTSLKYTRYTAVATAPSPNPLPAVSCTLRTVAALTPTTSTLYTGVALSSRTVIRNLVGTSSSPVFLLAGTTFDTCPATGTTGAGTTLNVTTAAAAATVPAITVNLSVQPTTLKGAVYASDCGTYLNNYLNPL